MNVSTGERGSESAPEVVQRPEGQLHDLPLKFRWEVTRRHPYYLVFWENAQHYSQGRMGACSEEQLLRYAAFLILGAIGVTGQPISPATEFQELGAESLDPAFLSGAIQPMTLRALAAMLLSNLPPAELATLGAVFQTAGSAEYTHPNDDESKSAQRARALGNLARTPSSSFDSYPETPLVYLHLRASQRSIQSSVEQFIRNWKTRRGIKERRVQVKKLASYLEVWDLFEGWSNASYQRCEEHSLREIATRLSESVSTIASRYRAAFEWITGHKFSPELWNRLLAPLKLSNIFQSPEDVLSAPMRRRLCSPVRRPVPDSVVSRPSTCDDDHGVVESGSTISDDIELVDLLLDVEELMSQVLSYP